MNRRLLAALTAAVVLGATVAVVVGRGPTGPDGLPDGPARAAAESFLSRYVEPDGRVLRRDQGGDTVSEGQAYAMLLAAGVGQEAVFASVWGWTRQHLLRPDGLLSWQWRDGRVVDPESAADADLDAARALVLAGERFGRKQWTEDGLHLGRSVLDSETVVTAAGRVLTAGTWVDEAPYTVNPSYGSPSATSLLGRASGDPRWADLRNGDADVARALQEREGLPPDWARLHRDGAVEPTGGPQGEPVRFGYDAARTPLRYAESCEPQHRQLAAAVTGELSRTTPPRAVYDLAGSPQTSDTSALAHMALAASLAAAGDQVGARRALAEADATQASTPTYYGAAWVALGRMMLTDDVLGGCPPLAEAA